MYLLMLLATFVSAIYGYNLSARPDYDRDVPRKKAMAVVHRFIAQHEAALAILQNIELGAYPALKEGALPWIMPGDLMYAADTAGTPDEGLVLSYKQQGNEAVDFYLRTKNRNGTDAVGEYIGRYLRQGRLLYDGDEMVSKVVCLPVVYLHEAEGMCLPEIDETDGNVVGTCCNDGGRFLVSYKKLDPRWLNKITNGVSLDFMRGLDFQKYEHNIGVVSRQSNKWIFSGKTNNYSSYYEDMKNWYEERKDDEGAVGSIYPYELMKRNKWELPSKVFTDDFFRDAGGHDMCDVGCLVKIQGI